MFTTIKNMAREEKSAFRIALEQLHRAHLGYSSIGQIDTQEKAEKAQKYEVEEERAIGMVHAIAIISKSFDNTTDATKLLYEALSNDKIRKELYE